MNRVKLLLAGAFESSRLNQALLRAEARLLHPYLRAINYHDVAPSMAASFETQLRFYAEHFHPVTYRDLLELHEGRWPHEKPGLIISFDDGLRSHALVAAPLLEKYGFPGWFMVPAAFPDWTEESRSETFARDHDLEYETEGLPDRRCVLSWEELRALDMRHVIGCHSMSHRRLGEHLDESELEYEIVGAKARLEEQLGHEVPVFAWIGGEEWAYSASAARTIRRAGFRVSFMTNNAVFRARGNLLQIQRTNVEAYYSPALMRFSLSGFFDLLYTAKRRRVTRLTAQAVAR